MVTSVRTRTDKVLACSRSWKSIGQWVAWPRFLGGTGEPRDSESATGKAVRFFVEDTARRDDVWDQD